MELDHCIILIWYFVLTVSVLNVPHCTLIALTGTLSVTAWSVLCLPII